MFELGDKMDQIVKTIGFFAFSVFSIKRRDETYGLEEDQTPGDNFPDIVMVRGQGGSSAKHRRHLL